MNTNFPALLMGATLVALSVPVLNAATPPETAPAAQGPTAAHVPSKEMAQMQARMRLMREQMMRIHEAKSPAVRERLLREHMQTMLEQMQAMRATQGDTMCGMMGRGMMSDGMKGGAHEGMMGDGKMARGTAGAARGAISAQCMQGRLDMMQMMMEQMMGQMEAMQGAGSRSSHK